MLTLEAAEHNLRSINKEAIYRLQQTFARSDKSTQAEGGTA
jgi:hypothetical protein